MQIVVYIQNNVFDADLGLIYTFFSQLPHTELSVLGLTQGEYRTLSGLGIGVNKGIDQINQADLLIVLGDEIETKKDDANLNQWLFNISQSAKCVVGLSSGSVQLMHASVLTGERITYPPHHHKRFKKLPQASEKARLVESSKFITTSMPSVTIGALLLAVKKIYGEHTASTLKFAQDIDIDLLKVKNKRLYQNYKTEHHNYIKLLDKNKKQAKLSAVFYLFDDMMPTDALFTVSALTHLPFKIDFISNTSGKVFVKDNYFKVIADKAIQNYSKCDLLVISSGESINQCLVNEYLTYWMSKIAPSSYRVLTIGEGEQMLGVSGALRDIDIDVLNNLSIGEGKYLMVKSAGEAVESVLRIGEGEYGLNRKAFEQYFGLAKE